MAELFKLTDCPTNIGSGGATANLWSARDIGDYDLISLEIELVSSNGGGFFVNILTGLQRDNYGFWTTASSVAMSNSTPYVILQLDASQLLRYLSWSTTSTGGTNVWISITGMGRAVEE